MKSKKIFPFFAWIIIMATGFILLLKSVDLGELFTSNWTKKTGGYVDADTYLVILEQSIINYRYIGVILFVFGLFYVLKNEDK